VTSRPSYQTVSYEERSWKTGFVFLLQIVYITVTYKCVYAYMDCCIFKRPKPITATVTLLLATRETTPDKQTRENISTTFVLSHCRLVRANG